jgi:serine phosphatase RsbU (regulator of sigma subunit)
VEESDEAEDGALTEDHGTPSELDQWDATEAGNEVSRVVQRQLLPRNAPRIEGYDIAAGTTTEDLGRGHTVWDWMRLGDGRPAIFTYNVQGEGLPPSHDLVAVRAVLRALVVYVSELKEILFRANAALSEAAVAGGGRFIECGVAIPGPEGVEWSAAGRVPAGVIRRDGTFAELGSDGPPLGMMEAFRYGTQKVSMGPGDVLVALTEASGGIFRGAADLVAQVHGKTAGEVVSTLHRAVRKAYGDQPRETTALLIRKH